MASTWGLSGPTWAPLQPKMANGSASQPGPLFANSARHAENGERAFLLFWFPWGSFQALPDIRLKPNLQPSHAQVVPCWAASPRLRPGRLVFGLTGPNLRTRTAKFDPSRLWLGQVGLCSSPRISDMSLICRSNWSAGGTRREATRISYLNHVATLLASYCQAQLVLNPFGYLFIF